MAPNLFPGRPPPPSFFVPSFFPPSKVEDSLLARGRFINIAGLAHAILLRSLQAIAEVAQLVHPAALMGRARPDVSRRVGHGDVAIGHHQLQHRSSEPTAI